MTSAPLEGPPARRPAWIGLGLVGLGFALDLVFDARQRDLFSWMDPYQYYHFALGVVEGRERFDAFEIPSIFPFFVMPLLALRPTIPAAIGVNVAALALLLFSLHRLCREVGIRTPSPVVAILVLCSPLLLGLSRTLYVEFTLTAIASATFVAWLRFLRAPGLRRGAAFGLLLGLGYMTKTTFPIFLAAPVAGAVLAALAARRDRQALAYAAAGAVPVLATALLHASVFAPSLGYYLNLVSVDLPFMFLMGPPELLSLASLTYYFQELGRSFLLLLTPLLALPLYLLLRRGVGDPARVALWLWLLGPLLLLTFHPLKEPRHVAACVVPAVLLIVLGIEALPRRAWRRGLTAAALLLALAQYGAVTLGWMQSLYFMDRPLHFSELRDRMFAATDVEPYRSTPRAQRRLHWRYNQNVALAGFPANEALALTWQGFPGVVFDLDTFEDPGRFFGRYAYEEFGDLFFLAGINTYNRRCGWRWYHPTLPRETVVANADFLILNDPDPSELPDRFPQHEVVARVERASGPVFLLRARGETTPYRTLYGRRFLEGEVPDAERRVIARELLMAASLAGDVESLHSLEREFPDVRDGKPVRNIYWISRYPVLARLSDRRLDRLLGPSADAQKLQLPQPGQP